MILLLYFTWPSTPLFSQNSASSRVSPISNNHNLPQIYNHLIFTLSVFMYYFYFLYYSLYVIWDYLTSFLFAMKPGNPLLSIPCPHSLAVLPLFSPSTSGILILPAKHYFFIWTPHMEKTLIATNAAHAPLLWTSIASAPWSYFHMPTS